MFVLVWFGFCCCCCLFVCLFVFWGEEKERARDSKRDRDREKHRSGGGVAVEATEDHNYECQNWIRSPQGQPVVVLGSNVSQTIDPNGQFSG